MNIELNLDENLKIVKITNRKKLLYKFILVYPPTYLSLNMDEKSPDT